MKDHASEPKSITASQRVKEFSKECLAVTGAGKSSFFCKACREELIPSRRTVIRNHLHVSSAQSCITFVMTVSYSAIFSGLYCFVIYYYNRNNERIIGQICWNNRENYVEIWNR